jgi:hypothetical protein
MRSKPISLLDPTAKDSPATPVIDVATGLGTTLAIIPAALLLGGFSFMMPWLLFSAILFFAAGFLRGAGEQKAWAKALTIDAAPCCGLAMLTWSGNGWPTTLVFLSATIPPTFGGIVIRRYLKKRARAKSSASL